MTLAGLRDKCSQYLHAVEGMLYIIVGALLFAAAAGALIQAVTILAETFLGKGAGDYGLPVLDRLLLVLMLIELLHTVRISVRSEELIMEPFLIVGLIASIRRVLVLTMQAAKMAEQVSPQGAEAAAVSFRNAMIELGLVGFLILVFVFAIYLLRRSASRKEVSAEQH